MTPNPILSAVLTLMIALAMPARAQDATPSRQDIVDALIPLDMHGARIKGARSVDSLFQSKPATGRAIKVIDGVEVPSIDLRVAFDYDSDRLSNDAHLVLERLAGALGSAELSGSRFRIVGHTDARGSADYNDDLSRRRAASVVRWLKDQGIEEARIEVSHKGEREPLPDLDHEDERHRRVEIQNIGSFTPR